jgi:hypothetical protein
MQSRPVFTRHSRSVFTRHDRAVLTTHRRSVAKGYLVVLQHDQAPVADGHTEDIRGQVLQGGAAIPHRLAVHHPILLPNLRRYLSQLGRFGQGLPQPASQAGYGRAQPGHCSGY